MSDSEEDHPMHGPCVGVGVVLRKGAAEWASELGGETDDTAFAPYIATSRLQAPRLVGLASITSSDVICDLGCGEAGMLIDLVRLTGCSAIGCDVDADALACGQRRIDEDPELGSKVALSQSLISDYDFMGATCVFLFLVPLQLEVLLPRLQLYLDADPRNRIISQRFEVVGLRAVSFFEIADVDADVAPTADDRAGRCDFFGSSLGKAFCYSNKSGVVPV